MTFNKALYHYTNHSLLLFFFLLASPAYSTEARSAALPESLQHAMDVQFPGTEILAHSTACKSSAHGPMQLGMVLLQGAHLEAVMAISYRNAWRIYLLPKTIDTRRAMMSDFLDQFEFNKAESRKLLEVRCINPHTDKMINTQQGGEFIAQESKLTSAMHVCFSASSVYNSWVCYWTKTNTATPQLSFVQFNAD